MTIKQLERELLKKARERARLMDELDKLKTAQVLPSLKKKYKGKYFIYDNGYNLEQRWPVYIYCHEVKSEYEAIVDAFELIPDEGWRIKIKKPEGLHLLQKEITRKEYEKNAHIAIAEIQKLLS